MERRYLYIAPAAVVVLLLLATLLLLAHNYARIVLLRPPRQHSSTAKLLVVLGSGGHTAEMLALVGSMDRSKYTPRVYVAADTDAMSLTKALTQEQALREAQGHSGQPLEASTFSIPRSREVGQSYITSIATTLRALAACAGMVWRQRPDLVLVNGPGTCIPICAAAFMLRLSRTHDTRIVYVESIARVASLSLSGKILYYTRIADPFIVQWPSLQRQFPYSTCVGRVM